MIKVSVLYPNHSGVQFDFGYYCGPHMLLVRECLGEACQGIAVDQGLAGGEPGRPAPYVAVGHLFFASLEAFQRSFAPHAERIMADLANFTDAQPLVQISEVRESAC
ncbi:EthD family reductase [Pseudomonas sp. L-22-4S-12]|uniref:EthD family reductase n=1 Tax=Pseudomonas sp. L-22-4S-12 TaxID=2610893 RepID=UPI0013210795|nr:EthD family reductase [Pseudomonas sp. L-22-4S-12]MWV18352.1 EthD family reductase [Pseudomonas sp. L-22-4S-12]